MRRTIRPVVPWVLGAALLLTSACKDARPGIRVAAAASLRPLIEGSPDFASGLEPAPSWSFDASSTLLRQIRHGAAFDLFLAADETTAEAVPKEMVGRSPVPILRNTVALVAPEGPVTRPEDLRLVPGKIAIAGPEVPAGRAARGTLARLGLLEELESRFVIADHVRASLALAESGLAVAAFVYATDRPRKEGLAIRWTDAEPGPSVFAVLLAGAGPDAERLLERLLEAPFQERARALGFLTPYSR